MRAGRRRWRGGEVAPPRRSRQGTPARRPDVRVRPADLPGCPPRASSRPRWPDAASPNKRWGTWFCPNRQAVPAVRRACTWGDDKPGRRGHGGACERRRARPAHGARTNFDRTPSESGRPGRIQGARLASSQVHARRDAARAAGLREASSHRQCQTNATARAAGLREAVPPQSQQPNRAARAAGQPEASPRRPVT